MQQMGTDYHIPVLLAESIAGLEINPKGVYVDATFGGGGHSRAILEKLTTGRLIAFDRDTDAQSNIPSDKNFLLVPHDYAFIGNYLNYLKIKSVDGILADLGISSHQVDTAERGFSFRFDAPLDMRMDQLIPKTAADLLNNDAEVELQRIFSEYGEIKNSKTLARAIVTSRRVKSLETTGQLLDIAATVIPSRENVKKYAAPVFQALRIAVNDELNALKSFMDQSFQVLKKGGRFVVITYHSLEDRIVKNSLNEAYEMSSSDAIIYGKTANKWMAINRKPIVPTDDEMRMNPRSRSAKLRIAEKR